ncbi:MAG TPA: heterodisulfide reductase-related iron-sulfur binding cluster [Actinomycetota bacterium]|jgi:glycolate oxidase iron-sulfur subunit|nr:heterodisulfide reductase-related iron-sulfur binding cluster [Actinomycetota bacterium]
MATAFDAHRPPSMEIIEDCVHCGFCLPTCPTYAIWGQEMDSPRGRIALMKRGLEEGSALSEGIVPHFDRCLGCMACVTACPSGVRYDELIEATRPQVERNYRRPLKDRILRKTIFFLFTHPGRMRAAVPFIALYRSLLDGKAEPLLRRWPRLVVAERLTPDLSIRTAFDRLPERFEPQGESRGTVALLQGCVQRAMFPHVNRATAEVLAAEGFRVVAPKAPRCCGALQMHSGEEDDACALARAAIAALEGCDWVVVNAAGCGSAMKGYGWLLADDPAWGPRAEAFSARVKDVLELLGRAEPRAKRHPLRMRVVYHDACHLAHAQKIRSEPRAVLRSIPELEVVEPQEWELCCGSAGVYNLLEPEAADALGKRKVDNLLGTEPDAIAAANPGCALQIAAHLRRRGSEIPIYHPVELLRMSIRGGKE